MNEPENKCIWPWCLPTTHQTQHQTHQPQPLISNVVKGGRYDLNNRNLRLSTELCDECGHRGRLVEGEEGLPSRPLSCVARATHRLIRSWWRSAQPGCLWRSHQKGLQRARTATERLLRCQFSAYARTLLCLAIPLKCNLFTTGTTVLFTISTLSSNYST